MTNELERQYNDMKEIIDALLARAETAEADNVKLRKMIKRLIEAGNYLEKNVDYVREKLVCQQEWNALVAELNASQNKPEIESSRRGRKRVINRPQNI